MNRCKSVLKKLKSRCVLPEGHNGKHAYPNALLKKEEPILFAKLQRGDVPRTSDVNSRHLEIRGMLDYAEDKPKSKPKPTKKPAK